MLETANLTQEQIDFIEDLQEQLSEQADEIAKLNEQLDWAWSQNVELVMKYNATLDLNADLIGEVRELRAKHEATLDLTTDLIIKARK